MFGAVLVFIKSRKVFLKVQTGSSDNLRPDDIEAGFVDYCLWSTFKPECIDVDGELDMECLDGEMFLFKKPCELQSSLRACYKEAFGADYDEGDVVVLME